MTDKVVCPDHEEHHTGTLEECSTCGAFYRKPIDGAEKPASPLPRPGGRPRCEHGRLDFDRCPKCWERDKIAKESVKQLADLFWSNKGQNSGDLDHLLYRAYRLGMGHEPTQ